MSKLPPAVPASWVADLFRQFARLYGAQRMAVMYPDAEVAGVMREWAQQLAAYDPKVVAAAIEALPQIERAWPPTLPEFLAIVAEHRPRPERRRALPVPGRTEDELERGRAHLAAIRAITGRRPARAPLLRGKPVEAREPGEDDEPVAPRTTPACTCWTGLQRAETLCPACSDFVRLRLRQRALGEEMGAAKR